VNMVMSCGFHKEYRISWLTEQILASQEGDWSMKLSKYLCISIIIIKKQFYLRCCIMCLGYSQLMVMI
jgi:hypothetical protein